MTKPASTPDRWPGSDRSLSGYVGLGIFAVFVVAWLITLTVWRFGRI